ncbi:hypothetical protein [Streptomyces sp. MST-110588]|uniref:hypothetical protein n=1 Tax=Streptomyces sp. MST-110588 TaxID=2833628 RepID=UPI001F5DD36F|nr:hypothetical protein [Streptomyces sp. MST-110588]UNO43514.1 hypothetical protein KGS77_33615 [Streptomyces sp. MST-110588]
MSREKVYDTLAKAIKDKDEAAYLKPFEGAQNKEHARKLFRNLVKVPFTVAKFEELNAGNGSRPVAFVHQIKGIDYAPVYEQYIFEFESKPEHYQVITGFRGATEPYLGTPGSFYPAPWDVYEDMTVVRKGRVMIISDKKHQADTRRFAPYVARAADDDVRTWERSGADTTRLSKGALIVLEPERNVYDKFYKGNGDHDSLEAGVNLAMPKYKAEYEEKAQYGGSRIVMDSSLSRFTSSAWRQGVTDISRHEIGHAMVATYDTSRGPLPVFPDTWIAEGFAGYLESRDNTARASAEARRSLDGYKFGPWVRPADDAETFYAKTAKERRSIYVLARLAIQYMAKKYGEKAAFGFVAAQYARPGKQQEHFSQYLGTDRNGFWDGWYNYVRAQVPNIGAAKG